MKRTLDSLSHSLQSKLQSLVSFLSQVTRGFDSIAEEIDCTHLKSALIAVAVESKQYAKEIGDQLEQLNMPIPVEYGDQVWKEIEDSINVQASLVKGGEIAALCNNCEVYFSKLYEDVLQEYFPYKNLKAIISFQLYATRCAFMKIRLLNTLRFTETLI